MEQITVQKWEPNGDIEVYYNAARKRLVFKKFNLIHSVCVESQDSFPPQDLKQMCNSFIGAALNSTEEYLAFQINSCDLVRTN